MKRILALLLALTLVFTLLCGCKKKAEEPKEEGLTVTFNNEEGEAIPQQTEPVEELNTAMEKQDIGFKGDHYGVVINNATTADIKAANVETFDNGGSETIAVMPYYPGSKVLVEAVTFDMETNNIVPTKTLYETTSTDDYALLVKVNRPEGVFPEMRITVEYDGVIYSHLIKNVPEAQTEYIR